MNKEIVIIVALVNASDAQKAGLAVVNDTPALTRKIHDSGLLDTLENYLTDMVYPPNGVNFPQPDTNHLKVDSSASNLSPREDEVLTLIAKGLTQKEIAQVMEISPSTVGSYRKEIYRKLNISTCAEATVEAIKKGLLDINYL